MAGVRRTGSASRSAHAGRGALGAPPPPGHRRAARPGRAGPTSRPDRHLDVARVAAEVALHDGLTGQHGQVQRPEVAGVAAVLPVNRAMVGERAWHDPPGNVLDRGLAEPALRVVDVTDALLDVAAGVAVGSLWGALLGE